MTEASTRRPRKKPEPRPLGWSTSALLHLTVEGHGRKLLIAVQQAPFAMLWAVNALEIEAKILDGIETGDVASMTNAVLDAHAHLTLPPQRNVAAAIAMAERYASAWQRNRDTAAEQCGCKGIGQ